MEFVQTNFFPHSLIKWEITTLRSQRLILNYNKKQFRNLIDCALAISLLLVANREREKVRVYFTKRHQAFFSVALKLNKIDLHVHYTNKYNKNINKNYINHKIIYIAHIDVIIYYKSPQNFVQNPVCSDYLTKYLHSLWYLSCSTNIRVFERMACHYKLSLSHDVSIASLVDSHALVWLLFIFELRISVPAISYPMTSK